ncbi:Uncharacterised protein [Chlamydia abortus]|nr:Uncharacterised protein [Chlamydia abortus]
MSPSTANNSKTVIITCCIECLAMDCLSLKDLSGKANAKFVRAVFL